MWFSWTLLVAAKLALFALNHLCTSGSMSVTKIEVLIFEHGTTAIDNRMEEHEGLHTV